MRSRCSLSIITTSTPSSARSMSWCTLTPSRSTSAGINVGGPTTRTWLPIAVSRWMLERATRECATSPQIATVSPSSRPQRRLMVSAYQQRLGRMLVGAVAGIDHRGVDLLRQQGRGPGLRVAHHQQVGAHRVQRGGGVEQRFALVHRRGRHRHVDHVGAEPLGRKLERGARACAVLEEQVDQGAPAQQVALRLARAVEQHVALGQVQERLDPGRVHALQPEQVPAAAIREVAAAGGCAARPLRPA